MSFTIHHGDCIDVMRGMPDCSVDSIVTDPPYELGIMGKEWDKTGIANNVEMWREVVRVLKPGGHLLAFSGSRTYHRMTCAIEDAGFDVRDQIMWLYGSGFPKSLDVSKAIDKAAGAYREIIGPGTRHNSKRCSVANGDTERLAGGVPDITAPATDAASQWQGWGTALKPAHEPICVARKPLSEGTVAANVLEHGTGALNIDGCRIDSGGATESSARAGRGAGRDAHNKDDRKYGNGIGGLIAEAHPSGRWPANLIHDGSDEVLAAFPVTGKSTGGGKKNGDKFGGGYAPPGEDAIGYGDAVSAARFFYCAKASKRDRDEGMEHLPEVKASIGDLRACGDFSERMGKAPVLRRNTHTTVKPTELMRYLVRLVTPPGGVVLDPFMGSGSTGKAAVLEGFRFIGIERETDYITIAKARIEAAVAGNDSSGAADEKARVTQARADVSTFDLFEASHV